MDTTKQSKPQWILIAIKDGKEVKAGKFATDVLAAQFARDYGIAEWRLEGPRPTTLHPDVIDPAFESLEFD